MGAANCPFHSLFLLAALRLSAMAIWRKLESQYLSPVLCACACALGHMIHIYVHANTYLVSATHNQSFETFCIALEIVKSLIDWMPDTARMLKACLDNGNIVAHLYNMQS